jgi:redox-sensitive bicupin YhaK (pirin superfamily)
VQRITAGAGIQHSEFNASESDPVHLLQIWLLPNKKGLKPSYEERTLNGKNQTQKLRLIAAQKPRDGAATVNQDVELYVARIGKGEHLNHPLKPGRHAWVQVTRGSLTLNGVELKAGDGAAVSEEKALELATSDTAEALIFDLA